MDDDKIVELYLSRSESAVVETAAKYGAGLRRIAYSILKDASASEECVNDAYLQAWELIPPNEPHSYLFAFLGRIVRHLAIDRCRKDKNRKRLAFFCELTSEMEECLPAVGGTEDDVISSELEDVINAFLAGCTEEKRVMFVRRYWFFDPISRIALRTGCTPSKVKTTLFRMRRELKEYLQKEGYEI